MEASFTARHEPEKTAAAATVSFNVRDLRLRTSVTDAAIIDGPSLNGLSFAVEKPGYFVIDFNVPKKDFEFKFHRSVKVAEKPLNLSYTRMQGDARTILNGTLVIDSANQVSVTHVPEAGNMKLKYGYVHRGLTTFEPSYDLGKNSWELAVSRRVYGEDVFRATYETSSKNLGLE
ncbi:Outer envelope pore protein 24, chloroplastic [Sesamum alatum]|uniref:Outer envelope pore protein 24, chloroplastic n=1 Tax=Sesamum alatum TaxID=300844 RepID=A0AAE1YFL8_9LAMI|nr:Outer envelope pore protein 24, chloroplastic [Sesamum alatum]